MNSRSSTNERILFFSIADVAERLGVSARTVRRWIKSGVLVRIGFEALCGLASTISGNFSTRIATISHGRRVTRRHVMSICYAISGILS